MEEDNFNIDEEGHLDVRYRGWTQPDPTIFSLSTQIVSLDISFNQLQALPDEIASLKRMKILNCSCNAIETIPSAIGNLRILREFKANGNKIKNLPSGIGNCARLSTIVLSENMLEHLPRSIEHCVSLKVLELQNNKLKSLPLTLANLKDSLEKIDVRNNPNLSIIPKELHGNSFVIMWIISFLHRKTTLLERVNKSTNEMSTLAKMDKDCIAEYARQIETLQKERRIMNEEKFTVRYFLVIRQWYRWFVMKLRELILLCKEMIAKKS